jgi:hypothetical protein
VSYDLTRLGPTAFKRLAVDLCETLLGETQDSTLFKIIDTPVRFYIRGRIDWTPKIDNGQIAKWVGITSFHTVFREEPATEDNNLKWLASSLGDNLALWAAKINPETYPEYLIIVTNVAIPYNRITELNEGFRRFIIRRKLKIKDCRLWHYSTLCALLDKYATVRLRYGGYLSAGNVLGNLDAWHEHQKDGPGNALTTHMAKEMLAQQHVRLGQAGDPNEDKLDLAKVGIDLPVQLIGDTIDKDVGAVDYIVNKGESLLNVNLQNEPPHLLLVGGPGQGKSTLTQMVCQCYRIALLRNTPLTPEARRVLTLTSSLFEKRGIPSPQNLRWPVRVNLSEYADWLAGNSTNSLLKYLAKKISDACPQDVAASSLAHWLGSYPWLVILDGMDEVASPALRARVSTGISEFLVDAQQSSADVLLVVTTRPQGYLGEFGGQDYRQLQLRDLSIREALLYARRVVRVRLGSDPDLEKQVNQRLTEAARAAETSRLMRSPLQVTIMTLLLQRRQRVPADRYQLFHAYFDTIYARESNKPTAEARFLEDHRSDIEAIHETVALELQEQAETMSEHEGSIITTDVYHHAFARLTREGNAPEQAKVMASRLVQAATQRLVLLVPQGDNGVGFEVRSLREYLAARALTRDDDARILERLRPLIPSMHWRNTWLLAAGRLFAEREYLRDKLIIQLQLFDNEDKLSMLVSAGANLATELLADDIALRSPQYRRLLADLAITRVRGLPDATWRDLAATLSRIAEDDQVIQQKIRLQIMSALSNNGGAKAHSALIFDYLTTHSNAFDADKAAVSRSIVGPEIDYGCMALAEGEVAVVSKVKTFGPKLPAYVEQYLPPMADDERAIITRLIAHLPKAQIRTVSKADGSPPSLLFIPSQSQFTLDHALLEETFSVGPVADRYVELVDNLPSQHWHVAAYLRDVARTWFGRRVIQRFPQRFDEAPDSSSGSAKSQNVLEGKIDGSAVQAGTIHGDVHIHH